MIILAEEFFSAKTDPDQLSMTESDMAKLRSIDPATMTEKTVEDGPVAWVLVLPTTKDLETQFLRKAIGERELLARTPERGSYDALYLCSALVLPEYRSRGLARTLTLEAVASVRSRHPIKELFVWTFSEEGKNLAGSVAGTTGLPLHERAP